MSGLIVLAFIAWSIYRNVSDHKRTEGKEDSPQAGRKDMGLGDMFKKDYQGVPIEVQRAISKTKTPPEASRRSTAFGENKGEEVEKAPLVQKPEPIKSREMPKETEQHSEEENHPLAFIEDYDLTLRPYIYNEILSKPKSMRK